MAAAALAEELALPLGGYCTRGTAAIGAGHRGHLVTLRIETRKKMRYQESKERHERRIAQIDQVS
jgi:hypothetical protein